MRLGVGLGVGVGGGTKAFKPTDLTGLVLWLDANKGFTPSRWSDQSGVGNDVVQATGANQPALVNSWQSGLAGVHFTAASSNWMASAAFAGGNLATATCFTLLEPTSNVDTLVWDGIDATNRMVFEAYDAGGHYLNGIAGVTLLNPQASTIINVTRQVAHVFNGASSQVYVDGSLKVTGNAGTNAWAGITVGSQYTHAASFFDGYIGEVIAYNRVLNATEIAKVSQYLRTRWAVT